MTLEGYKEREDEESVEGFEAAREELEYDSEMDEEWHADAYEGLEELSRYKADDKCASDKGDVDEDEGYGPSCTMEYEAGEMPAVFNEGSSEYKADDEYEEVEGDMNE